MTETLFKIEDDEDEAEVNRLFEMDTREVSVVDRAANKRRFLVIKRSEDMGDDTYVESEQGTTVTEADDGPGDLVIKQTRTVDGVQYPAEAFAFVPDREKPSTWKLRLFDTPADVRAGKPSIRLTAAAAQALTTAGFRGQQVDLPRGAVPGVKRVVAAAWLKARQAAGRSVSRADLPQVLKQATALKIQAATERLAAVKASVAAAPVAEEGALPEAVGVALRGIQQTLKALTGTVSPVVLVYRDLPQDQEVTATIKAAVDTRLTEVVKQLRELEEAVELNDDLDESQVKKLDEVSDQIGGILRDHPCPTLKATSVAASSVSDDARSLLIEAITKAVVDLIDLQLALDTQVPEDAEVAKADDVVGILHGPAMALEVAVAKAGIEIPEQVPVPRALSAAVEGLRAIQKTVEAATGDEIPAQEVQDQMKKVLGLLGRVLNRYPSPGRTPTGKAETDEEQDDMADAATVDTTETNVDVDALMKALGLTDPKDQEGSSGALAGTVEKIAKAATMFVARWGHEKHQVVLSTADEVVATFDSHLEAEREALRRNMMEIASLTKGDDALDPDVVKAVTGALLGNDAAVGKTDEASSASVKPDEEKPDSEKGEDPSSEGDDEADVSKVGRPMQSNRLKRLKGAVALLKDALHDLRSGSVSMEKFRKVGDLLGALITELNVEKRGAAAVTGGVEDKRGTTPDAPNVGSGVQPDTSTVGDTGDVMGDGTGNTADILKRLEDLEASSAEQAKAKDGEIARLKSELKQIKKARTAPSAPPHDDGGEEESSISKNEDDDHVAWPRDMAAWDDDAK